MAALAHARVETEGQAELPGVAFRAPDEFSPRSWPTFEHFCTIVKIQFPSGSPCRASPA